jgi:hypothetical protein
MKQTYRPTADLKAKLKLSTTLSFLVGRKILSLAEACTPENAGEIASFSLESLTTTSISSESSSKERIVETA